MRKTDFGTLETGNSRAGLQHILERHAEDFANKGIAKEDIAAVVMSAVTQGNIVGTNGTAPVYKIMCKGVDKYISVGVGSNGFVVRANRFLPGAIKNEKIEIQ